MHLSRWLSTSLSRHGEVSSFEAQVNAAAEPLVWNHHHRPILSRHSCRTSGRSRDGVTCRVSFFIQLEAKPISVIRPAEKRVACMANPQRAANARHRASREVLCLIGTADESAGLRVDRHNHVRQPKCQEKMLRRDPRHLLTCPSSSHAISPSEILGRTSSSRIFSAEELFIDGTFSPA